MTQKIFHINKKILSPSNTFKVAFRYFKNIFMSFFTVSYIKLNFKLKLDPRMYTLKILEEILEIWKNLPKTFGNPVYKYTTNVY